MPQMPRKPANSSSRSQRPSSQKPTAQRSSAGKPRTQRPGGSKPRFQNEHGTGENWQPPARTDSSRTNARVSVGETRANDRSIDRGPRTNQGMANGHRPHARPQFKPPVKPPSTRAKPIPMDRQLQKIGHTLKPCVMLASCELSEAVLREVNARLEDHELIKVKLAIEDRAERQTLLATLLDSTRARLIQSIGKTALLMRPSTRFRPNLSNIERCRHLL